MYFLSIFEYFFLHQPYTSSHPSKPTLIMFIECVLNHKAHHYMVLLVVKQYSTSHDLAKHKTRYKPTIFYVF